MQTNVTYDAKTSTRATADPRATKRVHGTHRDAHKAVPPLRRRHPRVLALLDLGELVAAGAGDDVQDAAARRRRAHAAHYCARPRVAVHMPAHDGVDAVLDQHVLELRAQVVRDAAVGAVGADDVEGAVRGDEHPGRRAAVHRGEVAREPAPLLAAVLQAVLRRYDGEMNRAVVKRVPERRVLPRHRPAPVRRCCLYVLIAVHRARSAGGVGGERTRRWALRSAAPAPRRTRPASRGRTRPTQACVAASQRDRSWRCPCSLHRHGRAGHTVADECGARSRRPARGYADCTAVLPARDIVLVRYNTRAPVGCRAAVAQSRKRLLATLVCETTWRSQA